MLFTCGSCTYRLLLADGVVNRYPLVDDGLRTYTNVSLTGGPAMARPKTGETPLRNVRVPDGVWDAAKTKAAAEGRTVTDVIIAALHKYVAAPSRKHSSGDH